MRPRGCSWAKAPVPAMAARPKFALQADAIRKVGRAGSEWAEIRKLSSAVGIRQNPSARADNFGTSLT